MTTVYFIRHAESDHTVRDPQTRPLTEKGMRDRRLVTGYLRDKNINAVYSSPYLRAIETVADFADARGLGVTTVDGFRERISDCGWMKDETFASFMHEQWSDRSYTLSDGECLAEVQERNIAALNDVLVKEEGNAVAIGTHGTALSTIINYYDGAYGYEDFMAMVRIMPWVVKMEFNGAACVGIEKIDLFERVIIREMTAEDYFGAYGLWTETVGMGLNDIDDSEEGIAKYLARNPGMCFVAERLNKIVGVVLCGHDGRRGFINHMAVAEHLRLTGIGRSLLDAALSELTRRGITKVALVVKKSNAGGDKF